MPERNKESSRKGRPNKGRPLLGEKGGEHIDEDELVIHGLRFNIALSLITVFNISNSNSPIADSLYACDNRVWLGSENLGENLESRQDVVIVDCTSMQELNETLESLVEDYITEDIRQLVSKFGIRFLDDMMFASIKKISFINDELHIIYHGQGTTIPIHEMGSSFKAVLILFFGLIDSRIFILENLEAALDEGILLKIESADYEGIIHDYEVELFSLETTSNFNMTYDPNVILIVRPYRVGESYYNTVAPDHWILNSPTVEYPLNVISCDFRPAQNLD